MMRIRYILHAEYEGLGIIEDWALENQCTLESFSPFLGEKLPQDHNYDILIIMGGPQSILDIEKKPFLLDELNYAKQAILLKKGILGFCLGAQILGVATGGRGEKSPFKEIGVFPIALNENIKKNSLFRHFPFQLDVMHWHEDMIGIGPKAKILASSPGCPRQIIQFSKFVYGFQCHLEMRHQDVQTLIERNKLSFLYPQKYIQHPLKILSSDFSIMHSVMKSFLTKFLSLVQTEKQKKTMLLDS